MIFYEAPHKLKATLADMLETFGGERQITAAREITKKYEEYIRTTLEGAVEHFENNPPKGEFVLIIKGADPEEIKEKHRADLPDAETVILKLINDGMKGKELSRTASEILGISKNEAYSLYLKIKAEQ